MLETVSRFLRTRFLLTEDMAEPAEIRAGVEAGIPFQGTNLWVLIFAILVASVGLNVNSTAVIIGAMLISPLMGPIVGSRIAPSSRTINVLLAGQLLTPAQLKAAQARLPHYHLEQVALTVRQGLARIDSADAQSLRTSMLEDLRSRNERTLVSYEGRLAQLQQLITHHDSTATRLPAASTLLREVQAEHPSVRQLGLSYLVQPATDSLRADTTVVVTVRVPRPLPPAESQRLMAWLRVRAGGRHPVQLLATPMARQDVGSAPPTASRARRGGQ